MSCIVVKKREIVKCINSLSGKYSLENISVMIESGVNNPGIYFLILKYMGDSNNLIYYDYIINIINLLIKQSCLRWRHINVVLRYLKMFMKYDSYYTYYISLILPNVKVCENMIIELGNIDRNLLNIYVGYYISSEKLYSNYPNKFPLINYNNLTETIIKYIKGKYGELGLIKFLKCIPREKYDIVFDGNNILLNKQGKFNTKSYIKLVKLYNDCIKKGLNPIVFIHIRIIKIIKKNNINIKLNYISTPYNYNDDWFSLYYAIKNNVELVSRDIYRDHINKFDTEKNSDLLKIFLTHKKLNITKDFENIVFENKNLSIIIKENDKFFIPGKKGYLII